MKKHQVLLAILSICFALTTSFTQKDVATTQYCVYGVLPSNQPTGAQASNPEWFRTNAVQLFCRATQVSAAELSSLQLVRCYTDNKICLVQLKVVDGVAVAIMSMLSGSLHNEFGI